MTASVVVTPTVAARDGVRDATIRQWQDLGWEPVLVRQGPPYGHAQSRQTAQAAIRRGLALGADLIIFAEDDIDLDPRIPRVLPTLSGEVVTSLWHAKAFEPRGKRVAGEIVAVPVVNQKRWYGSLCLVIPRRVAPLLLGPPKRAGGIDMDLRGVPLHVTVPSLVQHRRLPRVATRGKWVGAPDYEGPTSGESPAPRAVRGC